MEAGIARYGSCDPFTLPDDELVELLAYILARRSPEGALQSLQPAALRDHVHLHNLKAPRAQQGSHDAEVNSYLGGGG